eukprot:scaffold41696_cov53-Attheya_sp.AAC.1
MHAVASMAEPAVKLREDIHHVFSAYGSYVPGTPVAGSLAAYVANSAYRYMHDVVPGSLAA